MAAAVSADDIAYLSALVRAHDRPRYYATLFAPAAIRDDLFAIYGFAAEIARIPDLVSEPALGEIRLKWWSDALVGAGAGEGEGATPALRAISSVMTKHRLPLTPLEALIEARSADLYSDPPATVGDVEGRLGETESILFQMAAIVAGASGPEVADAAGHAGVAYGIARRLAVLSSERARRRTILPADLMTVAGLSAGDFFASTPKAGFQGAFASIAGVARSHLSEARSRAKTLNKPVRSAFLPLAIVAPLLRKIERAGPEIARREVGLADLESLLRIGLARLR